MPIGVGPSYEQRVTSASDFDYNLSPHPILGVKTRQAGRGFIQLCRRFAPYIQRNHSALTLANRTPAADRASIAAAATNCKRPE